MTTEQINQVQGTWEKVVPISGQAAALFYGKLFELNPELKPMFKSDIVEQGKKLMQMITFAVRGLTDPAKLLPAVEELGRRHVDYGVREKDYDTVGTALLWTLEQGLGSGFTPEIRAAWTEVYTVLAMTMQKAAAAAIAARR
jgi:hemoglobin-like flavoprotein